MELQKIQKWDGFVKTSQARRTSLDEKGVHRSTPD
jgi:hypothetical protein